MKLDMRCFQVSQIPAEDSSFEVYVFTFIVITTFSGDSLRTDKRWIALQN